MIPMLAVIRVRHRKGRFALWAPLFLIWLLLAPVAVILAPIAMAISLVRRRNPVRLAAAAVGVLGALTGLVIEVDSPAASVLVRIQ